MAGTELAQFSVVPVNLDQPPAALISIYKAAGRRYHIRWRILAAINAIETDYGRDLSVSPKGAVGWMQFMPGTWAGFGISVAGSGPPNPYDPWDAIFSAANYLAANGGSKDIRQARFAYNHALWYVDAVLWRAQLISDQALGQGNTARSALPLLNATGGYLNPLQSVTNWERTDQGVDATMPVGAPIRAPAAVKIIGVEPSWFDGQPLVWWELLDGPDAGQYQYVAEQITNITPVGSTLSRGQTIATYAPSGTGIEYGWATAGGETLAMATSGYLERYATAAGDWMRDWLNVLGAHAGTGAGLSIGAGPDRDDRVTAYEHELEAVRHAVTSPGYRLRHTVTRRPSRTDDEA